MDPSNIGSTTGAAGRYVPPPGAVADLIGAFPLCWILAGDAVHPVSAMLPLLAVRGAGNALVELFGHIPRQTALALAVLNGGAVTVLANGPQGYVSPELVPQRDWAPTWNFAAATITGRWRFCEGETDASLRDLTHAMEGDKEGAWTIEHMGPRYEPLKQAVVAFRIAVTGMEVRFKLGQDESATNFASIVARHPDRTLAEWMQRYRRTGEAACA